MNSYKDNLSTFQLMIKVAVSDGNLADYEMDFIKNVASRLNIRTADYNKAFNSKEYFDFPKEEGKRIILFHNLVLMIVADKKIKDSELKFCHNLGVRLGLNPYAISSTLNDLKTKPKDILDPKNFLDTFRLHRN